MVFTDWKGSYMISYLKKGISFKDADGAMIRIPSGAEIYIDVANGIGFYLNHHFVVHSSEYYTLAEFENDVK